jgi:hypothetical protein
MAMFDLEAAARRATKGKEMTSDQWKQSFFL